jgi:hypothetical protein
MAGGAAEVVECLPSQCEALSSNPGTNEREEERQRQRREKEEREREERRGLHVKRLRKVSLLFHFITGKGTQVSLV